MQGDPVVQLINPAAMSPAFAAPATMPAVAYTEDQLPIRFGRYKLMRILGIGGMGSVYLAEDVALQRRVALKIPKRCIDNASLQLLLEEARAAATINHPNVCAIYDVGCSARQPFLTMEYIEGKPLDQYVAPHHPMPPITAARIVFRIAAGLDAAHRQGVIHRDLKPANVIMRDLLTPVITDFGLAHRCRRLAAKRRAGKIVGSPGYMSPEQVRGDASKIVPATDVYGLGTILYELITGRRPFTGQVPDIYSQVLTQTPATPSQLVDGIDPRLDEICLRSLAKSSKDRFADVPGFGRALADYLRDPEPRPVGEDAALRLARPNGRTSAQSMYTLESRVIDRPIEQGSPSRFRSSVHRFRRWRWKVSRQRTGFVTGMLTASAILSIVGTVIGISVLG